MASSSLLLPETVRQPNALLQHLVLLPRRLIAFLMPPLASDLVVPPTDTDLSLYVQEQLMTGMIRVGIIVGTLALLVAALLLRDVPSYMFIVDGFILGMIWMLGMLRRLGYQLRAGLLLLGMYIISCNELLNYGFSQDASIFFALVSLLALLFFNLKIGLTAMLVSLVTLLVGGLSIGMGLFTPLAHPPATLSVPVAVMTCLIFVAVVGSVQAGCAVLFSHLRTSWQNEYRARMLLENERDLLEQRVAERTEALVKAHAQAVAASRYETEQKEYLEVLHQTTLDLLNRRETGDLLQAIVERATTILNAPYGELMLYEDEELVIRAFTHNQPFLFVDRMHRGEALLSWQAYDTHQPILLDDFSSKVGAYTRYDSIALQPVAHFPIMAGERCLGVLAMGRTEPAHVFTPEDMQKGLTFAHLTALVLDNIHLYTTALHEIAERKQAEEVLQQQAEELRAQNVELDAFAHTVAHDLKNPLTSLIGYNQLLQLGYRKMQPQEVDAMLATIATVGSKMTEIISALLLLANLRTCDVVPGGILKMDEILAEIENRLHDTIQATGVTIIKPLTWPAAIGYAPWIEEVWVNYISNAIKYGGQVPHITLGATPMETGFVRFWVQDNGAGLDPDQQAKLFTLFTRLHPEHIEGHGLGLSIVQRIVTRLGGEVGVQSAPGQGSTFFFTLPAATSISAA